MQANKDRNPWLSISPSDYEAHMGPSGARQLDLLSNAFRDLLSEHHPKRVAVLGCATGNGFEHAPSAELELLVGIDINPGFLGVARSRFEDRIPNLQTFCSDIRNIELDPRTMDLIFCGLFFEHVDPKLVVTKMLRWLRPGGVFGTVLQLPDETERSVSETGIESVKALEPVTRLVEPETLREYAESVGFSQYASKVVTIESGKSFSVLTFRLRG